MVTKSSLFLSFCFDSVVSAIIRNDLFCLYRRIQKKELTIGKQDEMRN